MCYKFVTEIRTDDNVPFINFPAREINCKLVYYGPGLGGKTANLQWIYDHTGQNQKGKMVSLATETDRTLFFDFLPLDLGTVRGFKTRFHLYTVPGQVFYEASRKLILKGADGVVFVADSQEERLDANFETMENLQEHLKEHNLNFDTIPVRAAVEQAGFAECHVRAGADEAAAEKGRAGAGRRGGYRARRVRDAEGSGQAGACGIEKGRVALNIRERRCWNQVQLDRGDQFRPSESPIAAASAPPKTE